MNQFDFQTFIQECINEKLQRNRIKVMDRRALENSYNNALRAGSIPYSYSRCDKIRALKNILNQIGRSE